MPLNLQTFKTRTLSAFIFAAIMLLGLFVNQWTFFLLFAVIHLGCWLEYQKLITLVDTAYKNITPFHKYGVIIMGFGFILWTLNASFAIGNFNFQVLGMSVVVVFAIVLPITEILFSKKPDPKLVLFSLLGLLYISLSIGLIMDLYETNMLQTLFPKGIIPIFIILCMWVNDTMAYIVGSIIGKTPFSKISPKKTWEGTIGGIILCTVVMGFAMFYFITKNYNTAVAEVMKTHWFVIAAIAAITGTWGDLIESKLKRLAGVKDSGSILPGHGGFLDRFDSLLIATPFVWLYIKLFL